MFVVPVSFGFMLVLGLIALVIVGLSLLPTIFGGSVRRASRPPLCGHPTKYPDWYPEQYKRSLPVDPE